MEIIQQQIGALQVIVAQQQVSVKRQRLLNIALLGIIVAGGFIAAVRPVGDATFDKVTCKSWRVVDAEGKSRIGAGSLDGNAGMQWFDKSGKIRINVSTAEEGNAGMQWFDKDGKERIRAATGVDGTADVRWLDKNGMPRIGAGTLADGKAVVQWLDKFGHLGIYAGTIGERTVFFTPKDMPDDILPYSVMP